MEIKWKANINKLRILGLGRSRPFICNKPMQENYTTFSLRGEKPVPVNVHDSFSDRESTLCALGQIL